MKGKNIVILGVAVVFIILVSLGVKASLEGPFPIEKSYQLSEVAYLMALEKFDTFSAEELGSMDIDGVRVYVSDWFSTTADNVYIDYKAPAERIKNHLIKEIPLAKERSLARKVRTEKSRELFKELKNKGLSLRKGGIGWSDERLLTCLERLNKLSGQEIKNLKVEGIKIQIGGSGWMTSYSTGLFGRIRNKIVYIGPKASLEEIRSFITESISNFKETEEKGKEKVDKGIKKRMKSLKKSLREKLKG